MSSRSPASPRMSGVPTSESQPGTCFPGSSRSRRPSGTFPGSRPGAVGADGWTGVKDLVRHLCEARKGKAGGVTLRDPETRTEIPLPPDLPDEAYRRLAEIENPRAPQSGYLRWDSGRREGIDPLAGLYRCPYQDCAEPATEGRVARSARRLWNAGNSVPLMPRPLISETTGGGPDGRPVAVTTDRSSNRDSRNSEPATLSLLWPYPASPQTVPRVGLERGN
jgi:hypothetical protein